MVRRKAILKAYGRTTLYFRWIDKQCMFLSGTADDGSTIECTVYTDEWPYIDEGGIEFMFIVYDALSITVTGYDGETLYKHYDAL